MKSRCTTETCDQVVPEGLANTLANAMSKDAQSAAARRRVRPAPPAGTCRCRARPAPPKPTAPPASSASPSHYAAANYIYDDSTNPTDLCSSPLRHCGEGDLYGGNEPARTWFTAMKPIATTFGPMTVAADRPSLRGRLARGPGAQRCRSRRGRGALTPQGCGLPGRRPTERRQQHRQDPAKWSERCRPGKQSRVRSSRSRPVTASRRLRRHRRTGCRRRSDRRSSRFRACRRSPFRCWRHRRHQAARRKDAGARDAA